MATSVPPAYSADSIIPAGEINFTAAPLGKILDYYSKLTGRTILQPSTLPQVAITINPDKPLTRAEAIHALDTVLALNGVTTENDGDKFVKVIPAAVAPAKSEEPVLAPGDISFVDMSIDQVLEIYSKLVGRSILRPPTLPAITISFQAVSPLTKKEAIDALDSVLSMNGISTIFSGDKFVKVIPSAQAGAEADKFSISEGKDLPENGKYITKIVQLQYAKPSEMAQLLGSFSKIPGSITPLDANQMLILRDNSDNIKRMLELIAKVDVVVPLDIESEVIPMKYALASDIASALGSLGGGAGASVGRGSAGSAAAAAPVGTPGANRPAGALGAAGAPGSPGYQPGAAGAAAGGARTTSLQDRLRSIVSKAAGTGEFTILGQTKIIADERTNALLVFAGKQDMDMIKNIVSKLDIVLAQVLIEAIIMEVTLDDNKSLGVSYLQNNPTTKGSFTGVGGLNNGSFLTQNSFLPPSGTNAAGIASGLSYFANFGNDFQATLVAAADDSRVNILSNPSIQTSHGVKAELKIGDTVPYVTGTYFNGVNGTPSSQYQQTFVGIDLTVTPLINPDGLVVMDINQDVQQLGPTTQIDGNAVPTTTQRTANAKVAVQSGQTIILGGFISNTKNSSKSGVPFLKDVPLLGLLFSSSSEMKIRQELIVLIKPTVLANPEDAARLARRKRDQMPGLKAAEADYRKDQLLRQKEADKIIIPPEDPETFHPAARGESK